MPAAEFDQEIIIEIDPEAVEAAREKLKSYGKRVIIREGSYTEINRFLLEMGFRDALGILLDLGPSSYQLENPARGFSLKHPGPLDMRMNPKEGKPLSGFLRELDATSLELSLIHISEPTRPY